jgi:sugar phosphate isomerase/epimerase
MIQIGVSSYSFFRLVNEGKIKQIDVVKMAKDMGFDAIEFSTLNVPEDISLKSFAGMIREECERVGIKAVNYTIGADFINGSAGDWKAEAQRLKEEVEVAEILGVPGMRHDASIGFPKGYEGIPGFDGALKILADGCRMVTEFAGSKGIRTMVENHGFFCQDSERLEKLVYAVNHKNFGILIDMGNFLCADEDPAVAVGRLLPYAFHIHVKDFHVKPGTCASPGKGWFMSRGGNYLRGSIIGHGNVPVVQCLNIIKNAGYNGVISIEFEGMEDPLTGISVGLENLKKYLNI